MIMAETTVATAAAEETASEMDERSVREIKDKIAGELSTSKYGLTSGDRHLLKSYLGYVAVKNLHDGVKDKSNGCEFVQSTLWPANATEKEKSEESAPFDLTVYSRERKEEDVPRLFENETESDLIEMFEEASRVFSSSQESGIVRAFQASDERGRKNGRSRETKPKRKEGRERMDGFALIFSFFFSAQTFHREFPPNLACRRNGYLKCMLVGPVSDASRKDGGDG